MLIDPHDARTWAVLSQTTPAERRLLSVLGWITALTSRDPRDAGSRRWNARRFSWHRPG